MPKYRTTACAMKASKVNGVPMAWAQKGTHCTPRKSAGVLLPALLWLCEKNNKHILMFVMRPCSMHSMCKPPTSKEPYLECRGSTNK